MEALGPLTWVFVIIVGAGILGLAMIWGMKRTADRTPRERALNEAGAHAEYVKEDAESPR